MTALGQNIWVLMIASALGMCVAPMVVFIGGIVGVGLAPDASLATLPVAALVIGTAIAVVPVSRLMQVYGRRPVFIGNALLTSLSALATSYAVNEQNFWLFVLGVAMLGGSLAVIQQFRFAAMESVAQEQAPNAASMVLLGGLIAAFLGPELAHWGQFILPQTFAGSFALLALASLCSAIVLLRYQPVKANTQVEDVGEQRALSHILSQPVLWVAIGAAGVGYAVMSYIMTATPVSMHTLQGHSLVETKWVIQSHIAAMFLPSFFSGRLIGRFGEFRIMVAGLVIYLACLMVSLMGHALMHYWLGLVLLGIGWNFLFVAGTALLPRSYRNSERFKVQGLNDFVVFSFQAVASLSSGVVIYQFGWSVLVLLALPLMLLQVLSLWVWRQTERSVEVRT